MTDQEMTEFDPGHTKFYCGLCNLYVVLPNHTQPSCRPFCKVCNNLMLRVELNTQGFQAPQGDLKINLIKSSIHDFIHQAAKDDVNPVIQTLMAESLTKFVINATYKFIRGQKEHGGDIRDKNLDQEIRQEHMDMFWYLRAQEWPSHLK